MACCFAWILPQNRKKLCGSGSQDKMSGWEVTSAQARASTFKEKGEQTVSGGKRTHKQEKRGQNKLALLGASRAHTNKRRELTTAQASGKNQQERGQVKYNKSKPGQAQKIERANQAQGQGRERTPAPELEKLNAGTARPWQI